MRDHVPFAVVKENCHKDCRLTVVHSVCFMGPILRRPIMEQMVHKIEALPDLVQKGQDLRRLASYIRVENLLKA